MKTDDDIYSKQYPTDKPHMFIVVRLYYDKGGMNYFAGASEPRGYYLGVAPETIADGMRSFAMFSGTKTLVLGVERKSPKSAAKALELMSTGTDKKKMIDFVCAKSKLVIDLVTEVDR
jgi:hypothetical protein